MTPQSSNRFGLLFMKPISRGRSKPTTPRDDDDPWAGYRIRVDDDDDDKEDPDAWFKDLPLSKQVLENMPPRDESPPPPAGREDSFFDPFDQQEEEYHTEINSDLGRQVVSDMQAQSTSLLTPKTTSLTSQQQHWDHQIQLFDEMAAMNKPTDPSLVPVYKHLAKRIVTQMIKSRRDGIARRREINKDDNSYKVLDVGCGTGTLFEFLLQAANDADIRLQLVGLDISPATCKRAKIHAEEALDNQGGRHDITVIRGAMDDDDNNEMDDHEQFGPYHAVIANDVFPYFWNSTKAILAMTKELTLDGTLFVTDPRGSDYVRSLNRRDPESVPHVLPSVPDFRRLTRCMTLAGADFCEQVDLINSRNQIQSYPMYFAMFVKCPHRLMEHVVRVRGIVETGYGRGGKQLGVPTANLGPSNVFQSLLMAMPRGVYFGWAVIEDTTGRYKGRNTYHKAVVNIGVAPTFRGQEHSQRIMEAHLVIEDNVRMVPSDFYNETMRLQLHGYLRRERKFDSFDELVRQIKRDIENAKDALQMQPYAALRSDVYLVEPCRRINNTMIVGEQDDKQQAATWIGKDGGNETASWELESIEDLLPKLPLGKWLV